MKLLFVLLSLTFATQLASAKLKAIEEEKLEYWKKAMSEEDEGNEGYAKMFKEKCGYSIAKKMNDIDFDEAIVPVFIAGNLSAFSYCQAPISSAAYLCDKPAFKKRMSGKFKKLSCKLSKNKEEASFKFSGTTLIFTFGTGASNLDSKATKFFEDTL